MKLKIFKGFNKEFLSKLDCEPLYESPIEMKFIIFKLDDIYKDELEENLILKKNSDVLWVTYEEYELIYEMVNVRASSGKITVEVINNNIYPEIYPTDLEIDEDLYLNYKKSIEDTSKKNNDNNINILNKFYSRIEKYNDVVYVSYYNFEEPNSPYVDFITNYYSNEINVSSSDDESYVVDIGDDVLHYLEHINNIDENGYKKISYKLFCNTEISNLILNSLKAYLLKNGINSLYEYKGEYIADDSIRKELIDVAENVLKKKNFSFRPLEFYKQPEISNEMETISQAEIMEYIVNEAEKAYGGERYRDIFITAPTGAGKSMIFQIPSIYLTQKYKKLIIIIEPLKGLQLDQQKNLEEAGYLKSAYLNSDIATMVEREKIIDDVKNGKIDILYVSPETLLSHSIESLIGEREIGLVIVDEAHIVTTWGVGFRPDYWYLGTYLNRMRAKRDKTGKDKVYHDFPIFACTATAVNGGPDDTVSDTVISLYMNDPIIKIGSAKRKNIDFDITNYTDKTYDEYRDEKIQILGERINKWINNKDKTIVYCPYSSIAHQMKNGEKDYRKLDVFKDDTCVYTGGMADAYEKSEAMRLFKESEINVMYATKAFGMGIDIPDIKNVYHYAVTGGLSDYIQEIGRAARDQDMRGTAIVDYFNGDMKYMNNLFGMSQIKQYHIKKCLSIIYDTYKNKGQHRNFLVNPKMFDGVFGRTDNDELVNKLKIVLLMLEKDFFETYKIYVLISRPSSLFTKGYLAIDRNNESEVLSSKYGKYFKKVANGRQQEVDSRGVSTTDIGDIFEIDLKSIWEEEFGSDMSFAKFKYKFFQNQGNILGEYGQYVYNRVKLKIKTKKGSLSEIFESAKNEIDYITDRLSEFERNFFTKDEFKEKIKSRYVSDSKAEVIANSYFDVIDYNNECIKRRENNDIVKYQVSNGNLRELGMRILKKSSLLRSFNGMETNELEKFYAENNNDGDLLKLLSLLDLITFEIEGGNNPEIFIRLNAPDKVKNIVEDRILYKNRYVELAKEKHFRSVKILDYFFRKFNNNENDKRWDFVEKYFLGESVEKEINEEENKFYVKKEPVSNYIDVSDEKTYSLDDYEDWDSIMNGLFKNNTEKYLYYCKMLKNNDIRKPDYAFTEFELDGVNINSLFIFEKENLLIVDEYFGFEKTIKCNEKGWTVIKIDKLEENIDLIKRYTNG